MCYSNAALLQHLWLPQVTHSLLPAHYQPCWAMLEDSHPAAVTVIRLWVLSGNSEKAITAGTFWPEQHTDETELQRVTAFLTSCTRSKLFNKKSQHVPVKSCRDAFWTHLPNSLIGCYFTSPRWGLPSLTIHALDFFLFRYFSVDTICEQWEQDRRTDTH